MAADHRRLEALLERAAAADPINAALVEDFRAGLLRHIPRHIGMEEKVLAHESTALVVLHAYPPVRTAPHNDGPTVDRHIAETLALAGRAHIAAI